VQERGTTTPRHIRPTRRPLAESDSAVLGLRLRELDAAAGRTRPRAPRAVLIAIASAWLLAVVAEATGTSSALHHDALIEGGRSAGVGLALFVLAWQAMIAAMMLPTSLPLMRLLSSASAEEKHPKATLAAFVGGYAVVWTMFAWLAFCGDAIIHAAVDATPWLAARPWFIAAGVLALAGAFQFSSLKDACLRECRHPGAFLMHHYLRGTRSGFQLGWKHGIFCLGCCWALMLVMFAAGVASLLWMAALTALMVYEKTAANGARAVPVAGIALIALAALVLVHPSWLPAVIGGEG
jgi:predicted metal-binding membrane protein